MASPLPPLPLRPPVGDVAWRLYDTYGFPVDLTTLMAEERNLTIDSEGFKLAKQRAQVRTYVCLFVSYSVAGYIPLRQVVEAYCVDAIRMMWSNHNSFYSHTCHDLDKVRMCVRTYAHKTLLRLSICHALNFIIGHL